MFAQYSLLDIVVLVIGVLGILWYYVSLLTLGLKPLQSGQVADSFRQFMSFSVTSIGVTLATFLGMLLGVRSVSNTLGEEVQSAPAAAAAVVQSVTPHVTQLASGAFTTNLQWLSAGAYVLSILVALAFWWRSRDLTDPAVSNLGKSLLGLVAGALAIALNLPQ